MFKLEPHGSYMMPAHFGPRPFSPKSSGWYRDVTTMTVAFVTEREALAAYLPAPYRVADVPVVTITYACNRQVDWLAGHGYNLVAINAAAVFEGEEETMEGNYCLVIWEDLTDPILTGRELQGIPKIYADIIDHSVIDGSWHTSAGHFGHKFLDLDICELREPTAEEITSEMEARAGKDNPMAWRYMPAIGGFGHALNETTTFPSENVIHEAWVGEGSASWQHLTWEQNPTQFHIVNALADLPVISWLPSMVTKGATNLVVRDRLPRQIR
ncbi:MAG: acetoacetate decarboxylase family protein [Halioglobus sp.]